MSPLAVKSRERLGSIASAFRRAPRKVALIDFGLVRGVSLVEFSLVRMQRVVSVRVT